MYSSRPEVAPGLFPEVRPCASDAVVFVCMADPFSRVRATFVTR